MPKYYGLVVREARGEEWVWEFGDFDRDCVKFEQDCYVESGYKRKDTMIIVFKECPDQQGLEDRMDELNEHLNYE